MILKRYGFLVGVVVWMLLISYAEVRGEIYRYKDSDGVVHYSDVPRNDEYVKAKISSRGTLRNGLGTGGRERDSFLPSSVPSLQKAMGGDASSSLEGMGADIPGAKPSRGGADGAPVSSADYLAYIENVSRKYGIPSDLIWAVIKTESNFNPWAVSPKGAQGLMQLMPATARSYRVSDPFDPYQNIEGGGRHLRDLLSHYKGDLALALAAYNAGRERVQQYKGVPPYPETRNYIQKVMSYLKGSDLLASSAREVKEALPKVEERIYRYTSSEGVTLFTDIPR